MARFSWKAGFGWSVIAVFIGLGLICGTQAWGGTQLMVAFYADASHPNMKAMERMVKRVEERTKGAITFTLSPGGALGGAQWIMEQIRQGAVPLGFVSTGTMAVLNRAFEGMNAPYVFDDYKHVWRFYDVVGRDWLTQEFQKAGLTYLKSFEWGFRAVTTSNRQINVPDDMKGLTIRTPQELALMSAMKALGANPVAMDIQEVYLALASKTVDGQENPPATIYTMKFYEVQKYMAITNHQYTPSILVANPQAWSRLSDEQRNIITKEVEQAGNEARDEVTKREESYLEQFKKAGMTVTRPDVSKFREKMAPAYDRIRATVGAEVVNQVLELADRARKM